MSACFLFFTGMFGPGRAEDGEKLLPVGLTPQEPIPVSEFVFLELGESRTDDPENVMRVIFGIGFLARPGP